MTELVIGMERRRAVKGPVNVLLVNRSGGVADTTTRIIDTIKIQNAQAFSVQNVGTLREAEDVIRSRQEKDPVEMVITEAVGANADKTSSVVGGFKELGVEQVVLMEGRDSAGLSDVQLRAIGVDHLVPETGRPQDMIEIVNKAARAILRPKSSAAS